MKIKTFILVADEGLGEEGLRREFEAQEQRLVEQVGVIIERLPDTLLKNEFTVCRRVRIEISD